MFRPEDIQARLGQRPFQPFRIIGSEGLTFEIRHPDLVLVGRHDLTIGHPDATTPTIYDGVTRLAMVHVVGLEDIQGPPSSGNGATGVQSPTSN